MSAGMRVVAAVAVATVSAFSGGCVGEGGPPAPERTRESVPHTTTSRQAEVVLDTDPYDTVRNVYRGVAGKLPDEVCARFTPEAATQFAGHFQAESCSTVVILLYHGLVADPEAYASTSLGYFTANEGDTHAEIDSCQFEVRGGPHLGVFVLDRAPSGAWLITAHRMERCD